MMPRVRCYAGTSYPERPLAFEWEGVWRDVVAVVRSARSPEGMVFDVLSQDGRRYRLMWFEASDNWSVETQL